MRNDQALELLQMVSDAYMIDFTDSQVELWLDLLVKDGDFTKSKAKLIHHIESNKFAPRIADFKVKVEINPADEYMKQLDRDRKIVQEEMKDPETRKRRQEKLNKLREMRDRLAGEDE